MDLSDNREPSAALPLVAWQQAALPWLRATPRTPAHVDTVTALVHFFWDDDRIHSLFFTVEAAFRMTWRCCGQLPSVLVTNRATPAMQSFCDEHAVRLDVDSTLTGGLRRLQIERISGLHRRFATEHVLILEADGFPLQPGLADFVGPYDYVGAPWGPASWYTRLLFPHPDYCVGNSGFSLRSHRICERAAWHYRRRYKLLPYCWFLTDDVFYARTLRRFERTYRHTMRFAPPDVAARFAFEGHYRLLEERGALPFGFHSPRAFLHLQRRFPDKFPKPSGLGPR